MGNLKVRQAIEYGLNKVAVQKATGGPAVAKIINTAIPPGNVGYQNYNLYPDNNGNGRHRQVQVDARRGWLPERRDAHLPVRERQRQLADLRGRSRRACSRAASTWSASPSRAPASSSTWVTRRSTTSPAPGTSASRAGSPTGAATTAARSSRRCSRPAAWSTPTTTGCFNNPALNKPDRRGRGRTALSQAAALWHQADLIVMRTPSSSRWQARRRRSTRALECRTPARPRSCIAPNIGGPDITNVWLNPNTP